MTSTRKTTKRRSVKEIQDHINGLEIQQRDIDFLIGRAEEYGEDVSTLEQLRRQTTGQINLLRWVLCESF